MKKILSVITALGLCLLVFNAKADLGGEGIFGGAGGGSVDLSKPGPIGSNTPSTGAFTTDTAQSFQTSAADGTHIIQAYNSSSLPTCNTSTTPPTGTFGAIATVGNPPVAYLCNGSSWTTLGTGTGQTIPAAPSASASSGNGSITCSSTSSSGATSYNGFMGTSSPPSTEHDNVGTTWIISGLTNTVAEYCAFKACNTAGCSSLSNIATATPTAVLSAPGVPVTVAAVAGNMQNTVSWGAPTSGGTPSSYNLYWSNTDMGSNCLAGTNVPNVSSPDVITSLTNGVTYFYMLKAINSAGASNCSAEVSATPAVTPPNQPLNVAAVAGNTLATLSWNPPSGGGSVTQYNGGCSNASNTETFTSFANITSPANITGLTNGVLYYCEVQSQNTGGTANSSEVTVTPNIINYLNDASFVDAWSFENNLNSYTGNNNLSGTATYTTTNAQWGSKAGTYSACIGKSFTSGTFPGYATYPGLTLIGVVDLSSTGIGTIISDYNSNTLAIMYVLNITPATKASFNVAGATVTGTTSLSTSTPTMVAGVWDGTHNHIYYALMSDCVVHEDATPVSASTATYTTTYNVFGVLGANIGGSCVNTLSGPTDEVAIFSRGLSTTDIQSICQHRIDGSK